MKGNGWLVMTVGLLLACPVTAHAAKNVHSGATYTLSFSKAYTPSAWTSETRYINRAKHKLLYGAKNVLLGWMELYNEPHDAVKAKQGFFVGLGHGLVNMLADTVGGALHLATFPITVVDLPLPEGGTDVL
ncbi:MAG: hypothetical protein HYZ91_00060 [Candidatus Omnitrophica bacterium]|nr:hypothetical protein [Candidatus Omnitrophota bacterium]